MLSFPGFILHFLSFDVLSQANSTRTDQNAFPTQAFGASQCRHILTKVTTLRLSTPLSIVDHLHRRCRGRVGGRATRRTYAVAAQEVSFGCAWGRKAEKIWSGGLYRTGRGSREQNPPEAEAVCTEIGIDKTKHFWGGKTLGDRSYIFLWAKTLNPP